MGPVQFNIHNQTKYDLNIQASNGAQAGAERVAKEAEAEALVALKTSAKAKLVAGTPLTVEEAATLVI